MPTELAGFSFRHAKSRSWKAEGEKKSPKGRKERKRKGERESKCFSFLILPIQAQDLQKIKVLGLNHTVAPYILGPKGSA